MFWEKFVLLFFSFLSGCKCQLIFQDATTTTAFPYVTYPFNPAITTNPCVCVTSGYCNRAGGSLFVPTDGSGLIDIRILNSGTFTSTSSSINTSPASTGISTIIASQSSCQTGLDLCCLTTNYQCGLRFPAVQGASTPVTGQTQYGGTPWFALIMLQSTNAIVGSGVLIDHMHILTVAHKVSNYVSNPSTIKVRLGDWTIGASQPIPAREFTVIRVFVNSLYNSQSLANSIAILRVSPNVPIGLTPTIGAACLSTNQFPPMRCWVAGYGQNTFITGSSQTIQQHVDLPIVDQATCQNLLRATRLGSGFILDTFSFLCAGGQSGRDACTGDGGAPLMCQANAQWYVVGLVAWGIGCGSANIPAVYINVTNYIGWIQSQTVQP
ncbi:hypothetical protein PVAND_016540 [Polypedilum vanderplanki]|uniref:Peptidase S1 domain-containing protein n=1 Tax=Polypedilum vanderplanki TaxID=319348 RepID=A0A9J6BFE8_POLVA|nr:hypothetical protein PVAND_016540 [Polypedilum vanderplanki]